MLDALLADLAQPLRSVPFGTALMRMTVAMILCGLIGWERERASRAAGLRTHMLIGLAAVLFTLTAIELTYLTGDPDVQMTADPLRLIEAVTSGVAFLAAGSIFMSGGSVRGVTTGASMWLAGAIGLACGTGDLRLAIMGTVLALIVLGLIRVLMGNREPDSGTEESARKD